MKMGRKKEIVVGIDVGTTKICSAVARSNGNGIEILGTGWAPSRGLKKGIVVNLSETIESVKASIEEAEKQSKIDVESAYVSVGGEYIQGINCTGQTEVKNKNKEVSREDIRRAIAQAKSSKIPDGHQVIHILTQNFEVDGQTGVDDPMGMTADELSVNLHLVVNASSIQQNIINAVNRTGVLVKGVVMQQLASAEAVLSQDEKELGTVVIDIGGGTIDVAIYGQGSIWYSEVLPLGGNFITKDIAIGLKVPLQEAERLKREKSNVFPETIPPEELIEVTEVGTGLRRNIPRRFLCQIVQTRCDEILGRLEGIIERLGIHNNLVTGVVLTGGGSLMNGIVDRTKQVLELPIRIGYPINVVPKEHPVFHPAYSTAVGLLKYSQEIQEQVIPTSPELALGAPLQTKKERIQKWFLEKIG